MNDTHKNSRAELIKILFWCSQFFQLLQKYEFRVFFMMFEFFLKLFLNLAFAPSGPQAFGLCALSRVIIRVVNHNDRFISQIWQKFVSSRKLRISLQASSEQADDQSRLQVNRKILPIYFHVWICLSIVTLECTSPAKRFPPKTINEKKFLSTQSLTFILTENQSDYSMVLQES